MTAKKTLYVESVLMANVAACLNLANDLQLNLDTLCGFKSTNVRELGLKHQKRLFQIAQVFEESTQSILKQTRKGKNYSSQPFQKNDAAARSISLSGGASHSMFSSALTVSRIELNLCSMFLSGNSRVTDVAKGLAKTLSDSVFDLHDKLKSELKICLNARRGAKPSVDRKSSQKAQAPKIEKNPKPPNSATANPPESESSTHQNVVSIEKKDKRAKSKSQKQKASQVKVAGANK